LSIDQPGEDNVKIDVEIRTEIEKSPSDVYRFIAVQHGQNHPRWDGRALEFTQLTPGPVAIGTRFAYKRKVLPGLTQKLEVLITEMDPDRKFGFRIEGPMRARVSYTLQSGSRPATTVVQAVADSELPGPQLLAPFVRAVVNPD
jgi:hypothetical protein